MNTVLAISLSRANQLIPFHVFQFSGYNPLQVKINSGAILIPTKTLCNDDSQYNMTESWRQLSYSGQLSDNLVICLPTTSAESNGVLLKPPIEDLPIKITQGIHVRHLYLCSEMKGVFH